MKVKAILELDIGDLDCDSNNIEAAAKVVAGSVVDYSLMDGALSSRDFTYEIEGNNEDTSSTTNTNHGLTYTQALRKLFEVMEGRSDIQRVKFNRDDDTFEVISDTTDHICFGSEFRK